MRFGAELRSLTEDREPLGHTSLGHTDKHQRWQSESFSAQGPPIIQFVTSINATPRKVNVSPSPHVYVSKILVVPAAQIIVPTVMRITLFMEETILTARLIRVVCDSAQFQISILKYISLLSVHH